MEPSQVLVTCGGGSVGLVLQMKQAMRVVPALRAGRLLVADRNAVTPGGCLSDGGFLVSPVASPSYVDELLELCRKEAVRVVLPLLDIDLARLSPHLERFNGLGVTVVSPPARLVDLCVDKLRFAAFARKEDLPHPRTYPAASIEEAIFPVFAKRRRGFASVGSLVCRSLTEARAALARTPDLIFQELIEAEEVSVDAYIAHDGRCTLRALRVRDKVIDGQAVRSHTIKAREPARLADRAISALAGQGLRGPLNLQLFLRDEPVLIEVNTRVGSASVLSNVASGGRFFAAILQDACGEGVRGDPDDYQEDVRLERYWGDFFVDGSSALPISWGGSR